MVVVERLAAAVEIELESHVERVKLEPHVELLVSSILVVLAVMPMVAVAVVPMVALVEVESLE